MDNSLLAVRDINHKYIVVESKVRNSYTMEVSYISLQRTIEQARKITRGLGNTLDIKIKEYYKYLERVFDALYLQIR
jgi:ATP-dependent DNA helicase DinG